MAHKNIKPPLKASMAQEAALSYSPPAVMHVQAAIAAAEAGIETSIQRAVALLGAAAIKPFNKVKNNMDFIRCIREGLPRKSLDSLLHVTGITTDEITGIIRTSDRTLRRYGAEQKLSAEQTERLIEIAKLYSRGEEVLGSMEAFKEWMDSTVLALGNNKPKAFLDTSIGIEMLMNELGRIEHGIFA